jgi:predicted NAD/FAD-binding protein
MKHERATLPTPTSSDSFWHSEPNEFLLGHCTTDELPAEADIVIVGSGITGASAARYLSEDERAAGKRIVLLEAREACWGATGRVRRPHPFSILDTVQPTLLAHTY